MADQKPMFRESIWYEHVSSSFTHRVQRRRTCAILLGFSALIAGLNLYSPAHPNLSERVLGSVILGLGILPLWRWQIGLDTGLPFLALIGLLYALSYGVPVFVLSKLSLSWYSSKIYADATVEMTQVLICIGIMTLYLGYYNGLSRRLSRLIPTLAFDWPMASVNQLVAVGLTVIGCAAAYVLFRQLRFGGDAVVNEGAQSFVNVILSLAPIGICMLLALYLTGGLKMAGILFLWLVALPFRLVVIGAASASFTESITVLLMLLMLYAGIKRWLPWGLFVAGVGVYMVIHPTKTLVRAETGAMTIDAGPLQRLRVTAQALQDVIRDGGAVFQSSSIVEAAMDRLNFMSVFAEVVQDSPQSVPYWEGHTYFPLFWKLVPVALYPNKPREDTDETFPHRYGILKTSDDTTAVPLPQLVEGYANFGLAGVILAMGAIGVAYRMLEAVLIHPGMGFGGIVCAALVFGKCLGMDHTMSQSLGAVPLLLLVMSGLHLVIRVGERVAQSNQGSLGHLGRTVRYRTSRVSI
jgi:hypothetical protein